MPDTPASALATGLQFTLPDETTPRLIRWGASLQEVLDETKPRVTSWSRWEQPDYPLSTKTAKVTHYRLMWQSLKITGLESKAMIRAEVVGADPKTIHINSLDLWLNPRPKDPAELTPFLGPFQQAERSTIDRGSEERWTEAVWQPSPQLIVTGQLDRLSIDGILLFKFQRTI